MAGCISLIISKDGGKRKFFLTTERYSEKVLIRGPRQNIPKDIDRPRVSLLVKHRPSLVLKRFNMRLRVAEGYTRNKTNGKSNTAKGETVKKYT